MSRGLWIRDLLPAAHLAQYFPEGAAAIINTAFEEELEAVEEMLKDFALIAAGDLESLHVAVFVAELGRLAPLLPPS